MCELQGVEDVSDGMPTILWEAKLGFVLSIVSSFHHQFDVDRTNNQNSVDLTIYVPWIYTHGLSKKQNRVVWSLSCFVHSTVSALNSGNDTHHVHRIIIANRFVQD